MKVLAMVFAAGVVAIALAIDLVVMRHESRQLFSRLEDLRLEEQRLNEDWGRLMLERATWSTHGRIEKIAREQLDMVTPSVARIVVIEP